MPARNPVRRTVDQVRWLQAILRNPMGTFPRATFFCPTSIPLPHLHTGLSKVENMITPADLARMLGQTPDSADSHTQDHLLYTSETPHHSADSGDSSDVGGTASHSGRSSRRSRRSTDCATFRCAWHTRNARHTRTIRIRNIGRRQRHARTEADDAHTGHRLRHACHRHHRHYQRHYRGAG